MFISVIQIGFGKTAVHTYRLKIHVRSVEVATQSIRPATRIKSDVERYANVCGYLTYLDEA